MSNKKTAILYGILAILTVSVITFLFIFLSSSGERHNFFYFQMGYAVTCAIIFWGWMLLSLRVKTHKGGTRSSITGGAVVIYVAVSAVIMGVYSGVINVPPKHSHTHYYAVVTVITFLFILVTTLGNIFASKDEATTVELEKPRDDLKSIAEIIDECRMRTDGIVSSASFEDKKKIEREFNLTVEILKRKVPDRSKIAVVDKIRAEANALADLTRDKGGSVSGALGILKNIQNYAGRI